MAKRIREKPGDIFQIRLSIDEYSYGQVAGITYVFYDLKTSEQPQLTDIIIKPILFNICVMKRGIRTCRWKIIGNMPLSKALLKEPIFYKQDPISRKLYLYKDSTATDTPATLDQIKGLECAAVWDPEHVEDRLRDHYAGKPNKWLESMKPKFM